MSRINYDSTKGRSQKQFAGTLTSSARYAQALSLVRLLAEHPWRGCAPATLFPADEEEIGTLIDACAAALGELQRGIERLATLCTLEPVESLGQLQRAIAAAQVMIHSNPVERAVLLNREWDRSSERAIEEVVEAEKIFIEKRDRLASKINLNYAAAFGASSVELSFSDFAPRINLWRANLLRLRSWAQFIALCRECLVSAATLAAESFKQDLGQSGDQVRREAMDFNDEVLRLAFAGEREKAIYAAVGLISITGTTAPYTEQHPGGSSAWPLIYNSLRDLVVSYELCSSLKAPLYGELYEQPAERLAGAVALVVEVEGPIHIQEVAKRIRMMWGVKRAGQRIQSTINRALHQAEQSGLVRRRGNFLWPPHDRPLQVRRRGNGTLPRIDLICDEEISEAIKLGLKHQYAASPDDLIMEVSQLLGVQATATTTATRIRGIILSLIKGGQIKQRADGRIQLVEQTES